LSEDQTPGPVPTRLVDQYPVFWIVVFLVMAVTSARTFVRKPHGGGLVDEFYLVDTVLLAGTAVWMAVRAVSRRRHRR
jgi:tryptophan-rich sensory protein